MKLKKSLSVLIPFLMLFSLVACSSRGAVDPEVYKAACTEAGLTIAETNAADLNVPNLTEFIPATIENAGCQLMVFDSDTAAKALYAQIVASINGENPTVEKKVDSSTYNKLFVRSGDKFQAVIRVDNSVFYGQEDTANGIIEQILEIINYK